MGKLTRSFLQKRWRTFSIFEQLGNVGSEFFRGQGLYRSNDTERARQSFDRMLELLDLTLGDRRWRNRLTELTRLREVVCDACYQSQHTFTSPGMLEEYFTQQGIAARRGNQL